MLLTYKCFISWHSEWCNCSCTIRNTASLSESIVVCASQKRPESAAFAVRLQSVHTLTVNKVCVLSLFFFLFCMYIPKWDKNIANVAAVRWLPTGEMIPVTPAITPGSACLFHKTEHCQYTHTHTHTHTDTQSSTAGPLSIFSTIAVQVFAESLDLRYSCILCVFR